MKSKRFNVSISHKIKPFRKTIVVDSDKSQSIRAFLIGSISHNISTAKNVLESDDVLSTINCLKKLNVKIVKKSSKNYEIYGKGLGSFFCKKNTLLDLGNSGTGLRLLCSILATTPNIDLKLTGDSSLKKRNMSKLIKLMNEFGAEFFPKKKYFLPLRMVSSEMPIGINFTAGVSSQIKSAVVLAGLNSYGKTVITENEKSRDHTENILSNSSDVIKIKNILKKKRIITIFGKRFLKPININIPGDPSSAAFFAALTLLNKNSFLKIKNVGLNPTRVGFFEIMKNAGAKIIFKNIKKKINEPFGDIYIKSSKLKPLRISKKLYVKSVDEFPIMFVIAAMTPGVSILEVDSENLKNKESDRIIEMQKILKQIGVRCLVSKDKIKIFGKSQLQLKNKIINVPDLNDHRICMSAFILGLLGFKSKIKNFNTQVNSSSPSFLKISKYIGGKFEIKQT